MPDTHDQPTRRQAVGAAAPPLTVVSSMATRALLAELTGAFAAQDAHQVTFESAGGIDVARRVRAREPFDVVALADDALATLTASGHLVPGSARAFGRSRVAVAVRAGAPRPDVTSEDAVRQAVLAAPRIGVSTGPSGAALVRLFEQWGIAPEVRSRTVIAPPGIPVGTLVASGEVDLGFQQLSELALVQGVDVIGLLPPPIEIVTTFAAAVGAAARQPAAGRVLLAFLASPATADTKRRHGMEPAEPTEGSPAP